MDNYIERIINMKFSCGATAQIGPRPSPFGSFYITRK
jgi:hypothetical protein